MVSESIIILIQNKSRDIHKVNISISQTDLSVWHAVGNQLRSLRQRRQGKGLVPVLTRLKFAF